MESGQIDKALGEYNRAIDLHAEDPNLRYNRGRVLARLGQWERARADYTRFLEVAPTTGRSGSTGIWPTHTWDGGTRPMPTTPGRSSTPGPSGRESIAGGTGGNKARSLATRSGGKRSPMILRSSRSQGRASGGHGGHWRSRRVLWAAGRKPFRASPRPSNGRPTTGKAGGAGAVLMPNWPSGTMPTTTSRKPSS